MKAITLDNQPTLTNKEKDAIQWAISLLQAARGNKEAEVLRDLVYRMSI